MSETKPTRVYKTTTQKEGNNDDDDKTITPSESFFQKIKTGLVNKPFKKVYRLGLLALMAFIANNTNSEHITDLLSNVLKNNICQNFTSGGYDLV